MWSRAFQVLALQVAASGAAVVLVVGSPLGIGWAALGLLVGLLGGAWGWGIARGRRLPGALGITEVRATSGRVGLLGGLLIGTLYAGVGLQPGQLDLQPAGVLVAAGVFTFAGGMTVAGLTLCGFDLARPPREVRGSGR